METYKLAFQKAVEANEKLIKSLSEINKIIKK